MTPSDRRSIVADKEVQRPLKQAAETFVSLLVGQENPPARYLKAADDEVLEVLEDALRSVGFDSVEAWVESRGADEAADRQREEGLGL